jgi:hypothetical protein
LLERSVSVYLIRSLALSPRDDDDDTATSAQTERQLEVNNDEMNVRTRKSSCKRITKQLKKKHFTAEVKVQSCTVDSPSEVKPPAASIPMSVPATDVKPEVKLLMKQMTLAAV